MRKKNTRKKTVNDKQVAVLERKGPVLLNGKSLRRLRLPAKLSRELKGRSPKEIMLPAKLSRRILRQLKRAGIAVVGSCVVVAGISMIPPPGPGLATIMLGLLILESAFPAAGALRRKILAKVPNLGSMLIFAAIL